MRSSLENLILHGRSVLHASLAILHVQGRTIVSVSLEIVRA
jgi:hypothetical protein